MKGLCAVALLLLAACSARTRIESEPSGARVFIDRQFVGYTPLVRNLSADPGPVRIETPGYRAIAGRLATRGDIRAFAAIALPPLLLLPAVVRRPHAVYHVVLPPGEGVDEAMIPAKPAADAQ